MIEVHCEGRGSFKLREKNHRAGNYESEIHFSFGGDALGSRIARDLLRVGQAAFLADRTFRRGTKPGTQTRNLIVSLPVEEPERWTNVRDRVVKLAEFVSQDRWQFEFTPIRRRGASRRRHLDLSLQNASISLFSDGLDSLCGAAAAFERGETPVFVSHSPPGVKYVQRKIKSLQTALGYTKVQSQFVNIRFRTSDRDARGKRNMFPESTRRTRPMLFLSMAAAVALEIGVPTIYLNENGGLAINLPFKPNQHGTAVTRHAHPETLRLFESLLQAVWPFDSRPAVRNPFSDLTKAEEIKFLRQAAPLAATTSTCAYVRNQKPRLIKWLRKRHGPDASAKECGLCSSCVVRRAAMEIAGVREDEGHYVFDARLAFNDPEAYSDAPLYNLVGDTPKTLYDFSIRMLNMKPSEFVYSYPYDLSLLPRSPEDIGQSTLTAYRLYRRFARQFIEYLRA